MLPQHYMRKDSHEVTVKRLQGYSRCMTLTGLKQYFLEAQSGMIQKRQRLFLLSTDECICEERQWREGMSERSLSVIRTQRMETDCGYQALPLLYPQTPPCLRT